MLIDNIYSIQLKSTKRLHSVEFHFLLDEARYDSFKIPHNYQRKQYSNFGQGHRQRLVCDLEAMAQTHKMHEVRPNKKKINKIK